MRKLVVIKIGEGSLDQGYPVTLQIGDEDATPNVSLDGKLPPSAEISLTYGTWKSYYWQKLSLSLPARVKKPLKQATNYSDTALIESSNFLEQQLNGWLNDGVFRPLKEKFLEKINPDNVVRVIIQTDDPILRRLPWHLWDLFASYRLAEVALYAPAFEGVKQSVQPKAKVRILAILGDASAPNPTTGITLDVDADRRFLESLPDADPVFLVEPSRGEFHDKLWDEKGWDILFFAGHSSSEPDGTTGKMYINRQDGLTIPELKLALQKAIERGLQLAIFNSCDGLGIARDLAELHIPNVIVMREPVPDLVAKEFLKYFLTSLAGGKSLYLAVREARERLKGLETEISFPCASWLPVIYQNPAEKPVSWQGLRGIEAGINWREVSQNALAERQKLTTNPLTTNEGVEHTLGDIYVPLGLVEKVKKEKRPGEVSPEEGSQFYQPEKEYEEVTRTYKNDEFFAQVLKQGQSPKSQGRRLAVTGEPGAGKTTLLQKTAQWVAAETERDVAIWVSLADLQGRNVEDYLLQKWLKDALRAVEVTPEMKKALALLFKSGRVWLLLDGVDEMGGSNPLGTVANQISGWVASARVVVTCRQNVWDAGKNALEGFDVYRNLDFDYPEGVGQFIHGWFARHPELGERLLAELAQAGKERIRDTVRNPLRLALLCRAWQTRQGGLPETKAGLYEQFAEALYEWKQEAFPTKSKQRKELNAALGRLALRGMEQSESRFRLREGLVTEILGETDEPLCQLALDLGWLNLVGVAVENPDERVYAFYHPTFQEYFAALAVDDWSYFLHHVPDNPSLGTYRIFEKQWKEVILLWFGRVDVQKEKKEAFIEKLINFDDGCGSWNYPKVDRGFYGYQAYFLAATVVLEFKKCRLLDEIIGHIIQYCFGGFNPKKDWDKYLMPISASSRNVLLAEINKENAIVVLEQLLDDSDIDIRIKWLAADALREIAPSNNKIIPFSEQLLSTLDSKTAVSLILEESASVNNQSITMLVSQLTHPDFDSWREVTSSLMQIALNNEQVILALEKLSNDPIIQRQVFEVFELMSSNYQTNQIDTNEMINERGILELIQMLETTTDQGAYMEIANSLVKIIKTKNQYADVVFSLKHNLTDEVYDNNFNLYEESYKLIWHCAQNLSYPEFYTAWHHQQTSTHPEAPDNIPVGNTLLTQSLETKINNILTQLQPTTQTYPLPINIQSLADETDTSTICQELCTLIYALALPDTDIPTVNNFAQLKQQILTVKKQLQKRHLALIFHNCKPHPPLLTCCRKIADAKLGLHILWITDEPLEAPLRGFPPSQDNLLGAMQSWMEEMC